MTFAEKLKEHRHRVGMSQVRLSAQSGIDRTFVSRLEDGSRRPSAETMLSLGRVLRLTHSEMIYMWVLVLEDAAQVAAP